MIITAVALILPTALYSTFSDTTNLGDKMLSFSRATAAVLLAIYCIYLYFQLWTHTSVFLDEGDDVHDDGSAASDDGVSDECEGQREETQDKDQPPPGEGHAPPMWEVYKAAVVLVVSAAVIMKCTHFVIDSLDDMAKSVHINKTFVALMLLPIASNACEVSTVLAASQKQKVNFAVVVIVGSILQIALFVLPVLVVLGWFIGQPMSLNFETSQSCILFLAVMMVTQVLQEGTYTYLHGVMLLSV
jgi:Ca2+:H+ antiporter